MPANPRVVAHARAMARKYGIDEGTFLKVLGHEGLNVFDPSKPDRGGDDGSSFGPAQLHYAGLSKKMPNAGLGDEFTRRTGLDARDPSTWPQQLEFAAQWAQKNGWRHWMGAAAEGITGRMGIGGRPTRSGGGSSGGTSAMKFPYKLTGGAAARKNSLQFNPAFQKALTELYAAAPPAVQAQLGITSGYRDEAVQQKLWKAALAKYGDPEIADNWVARPGKSRHGFGTAADLAGFGLGAPFKVDQATKDWVHQNAGKFGLEFLSNEPWHIQLMKGAVNQAGVPLRHVGGAGSSAANFNTGEQPAPATTIAGSDPVGDLIGPELGGEDKDKPLGGLIEAMQPQQPQMLQNPLPGWSGGGGAQGGGLADYIQQYLASRMVGGQGGQGGQGIG